MFGFHAISEAPFSATAAVGGDTHEGVSSLDASASILATAHQSITMNASSSVAPLAIVEIAGGTGVNGSGSISSAGVLNIAGKSEQNVAGSTSLTVQLRIGAVSLIAESSSIAAISVLEGTNPATVSATGSLSPNGILNIKAQSARAASGAVESSGSLTTHHQASIDFGGPFTAGFTQGFVRASVLSGNGTIDKMHLVISSSISARPITEMSPSISLSALGTISPTAISGPVAISSINLAGSLSANSVLLIGGDAELLTATSILSGILTSPFENQDVAKFTLYLDKARDIDGFIRKTVSVDGLVDSQRLLSTYLDKQNSLTGYIDKQVDKDLVRER